MRVLVEHRTVLEYSADVVESVMDARLGPRTDEHQRWGAFELKVAPSAAIRRYADGFGNIAHLITVAKPHRSFDVVMRGEIETTLADPFQTPRARPTALGPGDAADYLGPSQLVPRVEELETTAARVAAGGEAPFEIVQKLMHVVFERFEYRSDVTTVATTVRDVLEAYFARHPGVRAYVLDEQGELRRHVVIFVGETQAHDRKALSDPVAGEQTVYVMQALSGG